MVVEALVTAILSLISAFGYAGIFVAIMIESIFVPIPSEIILPFAGYLVYAGVFDFWFLMIVATAASIAGFLTAYGIGYFGGIPFLKKYGKYLLITPKHLKESEKWFKRHGHKAVLMCRIVPAVRCIISFPAGLSRMNVAEFAIYSTLGSIPWNAVLILIGYLLGPRYVLISRYSSLLDTIGIAALLLMLGYVFYKIRKPRK